MNDACTLSDSDPSVVTSDVDADQIVDSEEDNVNGTTETKNNVDSESFVKTST